MAGWGCGYLRVQVLAEHRSSDCSNLKSKVTRIGVAKSVSMADSLLSMRQQVQSLWDLGGLTWQELASRVWGGIDRNDLINRAYELAYNFLLAVFPMLLFLFGLLGMFASESSTLRNNLFYYLQLALPPAASNLLIHTVREVTPTTGSGKLTFGLLFALFSGSSGMTQLMSTLNAAYEVREARSWIKVHLVSLALTFAMSVLLVGALFFILSGSHMLTVLRHEVGMNSVAYIAMKIVQWAFALGFVLVAFAIIYYFAPNVHEQHWYWLTPGCVVGVLVWAIASTVLRVYLHFFNSYSKTYGSLGAVIILMLWFYVTGLAFLIGSQINATIEHAAAEHGHVEAKARGEKAA
jgi:membrane protein